MALISCPECAKEISDQAVSCPHCGVPLKPPPPAPGPQPSRAPPQVPPAKSSGCAKVLLWIFAFAIFMAFVGTCSSPGGRSNAPKPPQASAPHAAAAAPAPTVVTPPQPGRQWEYSTEIDDMSGQATHHAVVQSTNLVTFEFPYNKLQWAELHVREHARYGNDVMLSLESAQFDCPVSDCTVLVRFDDGKPQQFSVSEPADHSTNTLFIDNYDRFVSQMRRAKKVRIEAVFYQSGGKTFEFNVDGFDPAKFRDMKPKT
jgi:hypothetical protein